MKIINISHGSIKLKKDNKELTILGEAMMPKLPPELSEYVVYENSIERWDPPFEYQIIQEEA